MRNKPRERIILPTMGPAWWRRPYLRALRAKYPNDRAARKIAILLLTEQDRIVSQRIMDRWDRETWPVDNE